jgi:hypothetical protein
MRLVNRTSPLHTFYPLRAPLGRFEGLAEVRPSPLDLALLKVDYVADVHAIAIVVKDHLDDGQVPVYCVAVVDQVGMLG